MQGYGHLYPSGGAKPRTELTALQLEFLEWLLNPDPDKGSQKSWVAAHDVAERTVIQWKKNRLFVDHWERRLAELNGGPERTQVIVDALFEKAKGGDVKAMVEFLRYTEKFAPKLTGQRELDLSHLSNEELADLAENVAHLRSVS